MIGRGIDQVLAHPGDPALHEGYADSAMDYVHLAEAANGPIPRRADPWYVWGAALDEWSRAQPDGRIANLETSITRCDDYAPKGINYRVSPENAECLAAAAIDCCVLANNHVLDWGRAGLSETLATLAHLGIKTAGAGRNLDEAAAPAMLDFRRKGRVLIFSFALPSSGVPQSWSAIRESPGVNVLDDLSSAGVARIAKQVELLRRPGDVILVSIHWGSNWGYEVSDTQQRFARALIDHAGVSIVHGHSSHHAKGIEVYRDRLILYGCGDFLNDYEGIRGYEVSDAQQRFAHALIDQAGVSIVHGHSSHHAKGIGVYRDRLILYGCGDFLNDYEGIRGYEQYRGDLALMYFAGVDAPSADVVSLEIVPLQIRNFRLAQPSRQDVEWLQQTLDRESRRFGARIVLNVAGRLVLSRDDRGPD